MRKAIVTSFDRTLVVNSCYSVRCVGIAIVFIIFASSVVSAAPPTPPTLCEPNGCNDPAVDDAQDTNDGLTTDQSASGKLRKWNPGYYMQLLRNNRTLSQNVRFSQYDEIGSSAVLTGVMVPWRWSQLEGDTPGDYAAGIAEVKADIARLKDQPVPKHFILKIIDFDYGAESRDSGYFPAYLRERSLTYVGTNGVGFCRWDSFAMDRYIDLIEAYASEFEDEPYFEGIVLFKETAPALGGRSPCGYSPEKYVDETERMLKAAVAAFPTTNVILAHNYLHNQTLSTDLVEFMANHAVAIGGPDVLPPTCTNVSNGTWAYQAFRGETGRQDFRGTIPSIWSVENSEMGGSLGSCTPEELVRFADDSLHASHLAIDRNTFAGEAENQWDAVLEYISEPENQLTKTDCPRVYNSACETLVQ
mgnify:CR=1 FL=1